MPAADHRHAAAFTLLEVMIVLVIIGILSGLMISSFSPNTHGQLQSVASILGRDIEYAQLGGREFGQLQNHV